MTFTSTLHDYGHVISMPYMKKRILIVFMSAFLFACSQQKHELQPEEVESIMQQWLELWHTYDTDKIENIFWNSPALTYFSSEKKGLIKGYAQLKPHHEDFGFVSGGKIPANSLWLEEMTITLHHSTAVVDAIWYFGDKQLPRDSVQKGPCTFVIIKDEDALAKIAHVHFGNYPRNSFPIK